MFEGRMKALQEREERENYRTAAMMALHANINRDSKKRPRPFTADDFLSKPTADEPVRGRGTRKAQTPEQMVRAAELITRAFGGKDKRKKPAEEEV